MSTMTTQINPSRMYRIIRYTTLLKGRKKTFLGAFLLRVDHNGQPLMATPVDVSGETQPEISHLIAGLWAANQLPPLDYPHLVDWDTIDGDLPLVWNEVTAPTGAGAHRATDG